MNMMTVQSTGPDSSGQVVLSRLRSIHVVDHTAQSSFVDPVGKNCMYVSLCVCYFPGIIYFSDY